MKKNVIMLFIIIMAAWILKLYAQEYTFHFYNGDVIQDSSGNSTQITNKMHKTNPVPPEGNKPEQGQEENKEVKDIKSIRPSPKGEETNNKKTDDSEKLKRTGIGIIGSYSQHFFRTTDSTLSHLESQSWRAGLTFISSYDFNIDVEFLSTAIDATLLTPQGDMKTTGRIPGLAISMRNNYWVADSFGIAVGASLRGIKGTISNGLGNYYYKSSGASLSAGPVFQIGKGQLLLAYEYGVDHVEIKNKNTYSFHEDKWFQSSSFKASVAYKF